MSASHGSASGASVSAIVDTLRQHLARLSEGTLSAADIDPGQPLLDRGYVDSLRAVMLLAFIDERWGVEVDDMELLERASTLEALAKLVHGQITE